MKAREWGALASIELTDSEYNNPTGLLTPTVAGTSWNPYNLYRELRPDVKAWLEEHQIKYRLIRGAHGSVKIGMRTDNAILFKMMWCGEK